MTILLKQAMIFDLKSEFHLQRKDILIENGIIKQIDNQINFEASQVILDSNLCVSKGWVDLSVSLSDPGFESKEDLNSLVESAASGGFVSILTKPNTKPTIQNKESIRYLTAHNSESIVDILPAAAITKNCEGIDFTEMIDLHHAGAIAFTDGENPLTHADIFLKTLLYIRQFNGLLIQKPEDSYLSMFGQMNEGITSTMLGMKGIPDLAEELMIIRDLELLKYSLEKESNSSHIELHFNTISTARSVELIRAAKAQKLPISCSIAAHQLSFLDEDLVGFDTNLKVKPPFRTLTDKNAIIEGLKDGTIDAIVSEHQPHDEESKNLEFDLADFGIIGLETAFAAINTENCIEIEQLIQIFSENSRKIINQKSPEIKIGNDANLTLFNPDFEYIYEQKNIKSKSKNSPFIGRKLKGKVLGIVNKGQIHLNK